MPPSQQRRAAELLQAIGGARAAGQLMSARARRRAARRRRGARLLAGCGEGTWLGETLGAASARRAQVGPADRGPAQRRPAPRRRSTSRCRRRSRNPAWPQVRRRPHPRDAASGGRRRPRRSAWRIEHRRRCGRRVAAAGRAGGRRRPGVRGRRRRHDHGRGRRDGNAGLAVRSRGRRAASTAWPGGAPAYRRRHGCSSPPATAWSSGWTPAPGPRSGGGQIRAPIRAAPTVARGQGAGADRRQPALRAGRRDRRGRSGSMPACSSRPGILGGASPAVGRRHRGRRLRLGRGGGAVARQRPAALERHRAAAAPDAGDRGHRRHRRRPGDRRRSGCSSPAPAARWPRSTSSAATATGPPT